MEISEVVKSKYRLKKVLKISIFILLFFVLAILIFEYIRITPRDVHFSNITSSSVTVSWNTKSPTSATVIPFEGDTVLPIRLFCFFKDRFFDTRDVVLAETQAAQKAGLNRDGFSLTIDNFQTEIEVIDVGKYYTHHITVKGLNPEKEYSFMIGDTLLYRKIQDNKGLNTVATLSVPEKLKSPFPAYGLVKDANNMDNGSINDLSVISDGVIYFNYLDKKSGERSNIFSNSLGKNGSWYMDVSSAVDQKGENFMETHSTIDNDILVELVLDAGEKGIWKSIRPDEVISPAQPLIINSPNSVQDENEIDSVIKIQSNLPLKITNVFAADPPSDCENAACQFSKWCGPCQKKCSDGYWYPCACNPQTLANRQCNEDPNNPAPLPEPENPPQCAGGFDIGESTKYGSNCLVCKKRLSGSYYIAAWETDNVNFDINNNCQKKQECKPNTCAQASDGVYVYEDESPYNNDPNNYSSKDYDNGCEKQITCYSKICKSKLCSELPNNEGYELDTPPEFTNSSSMRIRDNCGNLKVCYYEPDPNYSQWVAEPEVVEAKKVYESLAAKRACPNEDSFGNKISLCTCSDTTIDTYVYPGQFCRQSKSNYQEDGNLYCTGYEEGMVCEKSSNNILYTCQKSGESILLLCVKEKTESSVPYEDSILSRYSSIFRKEIFAETIGVGNSQYLIDSKTGLFVNLPIGIYVIEKQGEIYSIEINTAGEGVQTLLYIDKNVNGKYDKETDINLSENASILNISPLELTYTYHLKEGFNFVSFPFLLEIDESATTAAMLLKYLNEEYNNSIYSIAKYDSSWKIVGQNVEVYANNDFQLLPGQGYVIKAKENISINLLGQPVKFETTSDKAPVTFYPGWNLIGVYGTKVKQYTAKSLLQDINAYDKIDFTADIVNGWDNDVQGYEGFVLENESGVDMEYGFDFPINTLNSYFVRVQNGTGNWQPKLAE